MTAEPDDLRSVRADIGRINRLALGVIGVFVFGFLGWASVFNLSGAVIATGTVVVEGNSRRVQHPSGGIVAGIFVREGETVREGQLLLRLDDTLTRANLGIVRTQIDELSAREARLVAERDGLAAIAFPADLLARRDDPGVAGAIAGERRLLDARRTSREGQRAQLRERIAQLNEEVVGLGIQIDTKQREEDLITEEVRGVGQLFRQNLVTLQRFVAVQRDQTRISGERGTLIADRARARGRIAEVELQIIQLDQDHGAEVIAELREVQGNLGQLRERRVAAEDQLARIEIRAPASGVAHNVAVHTVGGVVQAGEALMLIVPSEERLVGDVRVAPGDVDQVVPDAVATIKVLAGNQRTAIDMAGQVLRVGADQTRDPQTGIAFFTVRVGFDTQERERQTGFRLVPGMPIQVFIRTHDRTVLDYLMRPLFEQMQRAFRER